MRITIAPVSSSPAMIARWIGAAPRQRGSSGGMQVEAAEPGRIEHRLRQQQAVSDDDRRIEAETRKRVLLLRALERDGRAHLDPVREREAMDGRRLGLVAAALGPRRLGIDAGDLVALGDEIGKRRHREVGRAP